MSLRAIVNGFAVVLSAFGLSLVVSTQTGQDRPAGFDVNPNVHRVGNAAAGQDVFRFETFGNEGFWTDAVRLPQGMIAIGATPIAALRIGLSFDRDRINPTFYGQLAAELQTDLSPQNAPLLNSPANLLRLLSDNAVIGLVTKDTNNDGVLNVAGGDKVGVSCALCHTITDASLGAVSGGGSIGRRQDGRAPHTLKFGALLAAGLNSRAFYPGLQLALDANGGKTLGRAPTGLTENSTEAEVDAYLSNPLFYPPGMFDDTVDGNGDPMHNAALFRTDLGAPWGTEGGLQFLDNFSNLVYTALLDPTNLTTPGGRAFLRKLGGDAAGQEIADKYVKVLAATGVTGYPFLRASVSPTPGAESAPLGIRVDDTKLVDMNAYLNSLQAPAGTVEDPDAVSRARAQFRTQCTFCHDVDQSRFVPSGIVPMATIFPGDNPIVLLPTRTPPLNPILDTPGNIFVNPVNIYDDKMAVVNASMRGLIRGTAMPLLLDLARKPNFLHDNSVPNLDALLDPARGAAAPHPFYLANPNQRRDMAAFLRNLDTTSGSPR